MTDKTTVKPSETYVEKIFREIDESLLEGYVPLGIKKTRKQKQRVAKAAAMKEVINAD